MKFNCRMRIRKEENCLFLFFILIERLKMLINGGFKMKKYVSVWAIIMFLAVPSVATAMEEVKFIQAVDPGFVQPVDTDVSQAGDFYVLDRKASKVYVFDKEGKFQWGFGDRGFALGKMSLPNSLAISLKGNVVIADTGNYRAQVFNRNGQILFELGNKGTLPGEFKNATSVAVDPLENIYVADTELNRISQFSPKGVFLKVMNLEYKPMDLAFDKQGAMYVLLSEAGKIVKYSIAGDELKEITYYQDKDNVLASTVGMTVDSKGDIYLVEHNKQSIKKIDHKSQLLFSFGSQGVGKGQFNHPLGISADDLGKIYIADSANKRVQVLEINGSTKPELAQAVYLRPVIDYQKSLSANDSISDVDYVPNKGLYALSNEKGYIIVKGELNQLIGDSSDEKLHLSNPKAIHVMDDGRMLVADTGHHRLKFLKTDGTHDYTFGNKGDQDGEFNALEGVASDSKGYIYVADTNNNRIQMFNSDGIYLSSFGRKTEVLDDANPMGGTFLHPKDLAFNSKDHLYVLDYKNKRIQIFDDQKIFIKEIGGARDLVKFLEPIDIAIDNNDYLYVADRGEHNIKVFDHEGQLVLTFGSNGKGPSHFPALSAIASWEGQIYVANKNLDDIAVFAFQPNNTMKKERVYITKISLPLLMDNATEEIKQTMAKKLTFENIRKELSQKLNVSEDILNQVIKVEAEEYLGDGRLKLTVSAPKVLRMTKTEVEPIQ